LSEGSASRSFRERSQFSPFYLEPVSPYGRLSVVLRHIGRGLAPGGRPSFLLYDKKEGKETYPAVAPPSGVPSLRQCRAGSSQTRPSGSDMRSPLSARHHLQSARQRGPEMQVINGQCPTQVPQGLGVSEKPVPTPPSSAPAGGEVRRGCLSPKGEFRAGRLLGAAQGSHSRSE